jgi:hypothetical protein
MSPVSAVSYVSGTTNAGRVGPRGVTAHIHPCNRRRAHLQCWGAGEFSFVEHGGSRVFAASTSHQSLEKPISPPYENEQPRQRCPAESDLADVAFNMPLGASTGWEENRIAGVQAAGCACDVFNDNAAFDHVDRLVDVINPIESARRTIPNDRTCTAIRTAREDLVARDRIAFQNPVGIDRRWIQGDLSDPQPNDACNCHSMAQGLPTPMSRYRSKVSPASPLDPKTKIQPKRNTNCASVRWCTLGSAATDDRERFQIAPFNGIWSIDTSDILVNRGVGHRPLGGGGHILFDFRNEFDAQVSPFTFIPCCEFGSNPRHPNPTD